jgi:chromosomal replication initiation ATPase DnaA
MSQAGRPLQLRLDFPQLSPGARPLITTGAYRAPVASLAAWRLWPDGQLALIGAEGAGKSRLLLHWATEVGAALADGGAFRGSDIHEVSELSFGALAIDNADLAPPDILLGALNLCRNRAAPLLVAGSSHPGGWAQGPKDLVSRLNAIPVCEIEAPGPETLRERLKEACALRHILLSDDAIRRLVEHMTRSYGRIAEVADLIEEEAGAGPRSSLARRVLARLHARREFE